MAANKLTKQCKDDIVRWLALGECINTVVMKVKRDYQIEISYQNVYDNYLYNSKTRKRILEIQEKWEAELDKIAISKKAVRLKKAQEALDKALNSTKERYVYSREGVLEEIIYEHNLAPVSGLIREARAEIEGDPTVGKGTQIGLVQIIKNVTQTAEDKFKAMKNSKDENVRNRLKGSKDLEEALDSGSYSVDPADFGDIEIL